MGKRRWGAAIAAMVLALGATAGRAAEATPIPIEAFYRNADIDEVELSPSGRRIAMSTGVAGGRFSLAVFDLQDGKRIDVVARYADADIGEFKWVNDDYLVYSLTDRSVGGGFQRFNRGLYSVRADGSEPRQLVKLRNDLVVTRRTGPELLSDEHRLLAVPTTGGTEVIVGRPVWSGSGDMVELVPLRLDVVTRATRTLALGSPANATRWWFDPKGEARLVAGTKDGQTRLHWRAPGQDGWAELARFPVLEAPFWPHSIDAGGQLFVTVGRGGAGYDVLKRFDFATGKPEADPIVSTPGFDYEGELVNAYGSSAKALGVRAWTDAETTHWFDPRLKKVQTAVDARFPGRVNRLVCRACESDDMTVLVHSWSDQEPGQLWVYQPAKDRWQGVGRFRADIDPKHMATLDLHRIKARDGIDLPVWLTLPPGADKKSPRAAVVLVHGGPWVRGSRWEWDANAQFLASRGYVVIEPEFRGSTGYGDRHFRAGWKQWGLAMQDDVADALNWAVTQGWVDPKRVCIAGASYGGFATLSGLVRHPELYRCGVAWVAVTDPRLLFNSDWMNDISSEARLHTMPEMIGDPVKDAAALAAIAPVEQAARIKAPVLLAFGGADTRVPIEHGTRMRAALKAAGNEPEWVLYPDEWHGWYKAENRYDFARRMEQFLAKHLK